MAIKYKCNTPCELIFFNVNVDIEREKNSTSPVQNIVLVAARHVMLNK